MKGVFQRGNKWWFRFSYRGRQRFVNLGTDSEVDAITRAMSVLEEPSKWIGEKAQAEGLLTDFLALKKARGVSDSWLENERLRIHCFFRDHKVKHVTQINRARVTQWADSHWSRNPETGNAYLATLSRFTRWLKDNGHIATDPCPEIPRMRVRTRVRRNFLRKEQCRLLLDTCGEVDLKLCLYLALHCGLRKAECLHVAPHWIDLDAGLLHVTASKDWQPKDADNRTIPLTREFAEFLEPYAKREPYLVRPEVPAGSSRYRWNCRRPFMLLLEETGIDCTFHDLRRTFASLHVSAGTSIYKVAKWLGDGVAVVEKHYGHLIPNDEEINNAWD